jgi:integrase
MARRRANGEGTVVPRKDGRWMASMSLPNGRRKHFLGRTRAEAAAKLTEAMADRQKGIPIVTSRQNVSQYLTYWLESVKGSVRPRTHESYDLNVRRLKPLIGKTRLNSLSPAAIERAYAELVAGGLSRRSVVQAHTVLHNALKKAVKWGLLGRNPTEAVSVPRPERNEMKTLSEEQVRTLFAATAGSYYHGLWVLLTTTGLRLGEALGLMWEDVDFVSSRLMVRRALQRQRDHKLVLVEPKTAKSRRTVYFPEGTSQALREHRRLQAEARLLAGSGWQDNGLVFCTETGRPIEPAGVSKRLQRILKKAELPQIRVHDLRHTAATLHLARGENPKVVQELLGHSTIAVTMDTYSHVTPGIHAAAAAKMQALFG